MSRPPAAPVDTIVDAASCARSDKTLRRHYTAADLPRLGEAGVPAGSGAIDASFRFSVLDGHPAIDGTLHGTVVLACQRCMRPVPVAVDEDFQVIVVREERSDEPGGYEPVIADPARLDLRWLTEEQALLALPLVPMHESQDCAAPAQAASGDSERQPDADGKADDDSVRQQPFQHLRDMMRRS